MYPLVLHPTPVDQSERQPMVQLSISRSKLLEQDQYVKDIYLTDETDEAPASRLVLSD